MHFLAVLNRDGGTLRTTDLSAFADRCRVTLSEAGHTLDVVVVGGKDVVKALKAAASKDGVDVVMAGGGDGTVSAAAAAMMDGGKALAILPAGTMNLFARGLGIPLGLDEAVTAFATGQLRAVDVASANGQPFVHQFSIGMHAKLVALRSKMNYKSRLGKIRASSKAAFDTIMNPPAIRATLAMDDGHELVVHSTGVGISNNLFGEGHLPFADEPDGGVLGIYIARARKRRELILFSLNMALGRWERNEHLDIHRCRSVTLTIKPTRRKQRSVIDGELCTLDPVTRIEIRPGALKVLIPADALKQPEPE